MNDATSPGELGSLAQSARTKQLKSARGILLFVGILTLAVNAFFGSQARTMVDAEIKKEIAKLPFGTEVDQGKVDELRETAVRSVQMSSFIAAGLGVVFIIFAMMVYKYPVPVTIASLVLYVGSAAVFGFLDPTTLGKGVIIKVLIAAGLFKAVQAAIASERETQPLAAA